MDRYTGELEFLLMLLREGETPTKEVVERLIRLLIEQQETV